MGEIIKTIPVKETRNIKVEVNDQIISRTIIPKTDFTCSKGINESVNSIHVAKIQDTEKTIVFYENRSGNILPCMDVRIETLLTRVDPETKLFVTQNGVIIFWSEYELFATIDMLPFNLYDGNAAEIFNEFTIKNIYSQNGKDFIEAQRRCTPNPGTGTFELISEILEDNNCEIHFIPIEES